MRYHQYFLAIHRYCPSGRFCENGISLTFILRQSVPRQLHAGTVRLWRWNSNHSDLGNKKWTISFQICSTDTSTLMILIRKKCISEFTDKLELKNLRGAFSSVRRRGPAPRPGHGQAATWEHCVHLLVPVGVAEDTLSHSPQRWQECGRWEAGDQGLRRRSQSSSHRLRRRPRHPNRRARTQRR